MTAPAESPPAGGAHPESGSKLMGDVRRIGKGIWNRVKGTLGIGLETTVGQIPDELGEAGTRIGLKSKRTGRFNKIGEAGKETAEFVAKTTALPFVVAEKTAKAGGGTWKYLISMPGRIWDRTWQGIQNLWDLWIHGSKKHAGGGHASAESHDDTPHGAAPAH